MNIDGYPVEFDIDLSFLRTRGDSDCFKTFSETPIVLEGALYTLFQVNSVQVIKRTIPSATLRIVALDLPKPTYFSNGALQSMIPEIRTYDFPISRATMSVFHKTVGYGMLEYNALWCSNECATKRREYVCDGCFSKSYWSLKKLSDEHVTKLIKQSTPPVIVYDPLHPSSYLIPDGAILVDYRDIQDEENKGEGGHYLPLTLSILAILKKYTMSKTFKLQEIMLYKILDNYNFLDTTSLHPEGRGWPYTRADVKRCLRFCTYTLEYINNELDDNNDVVYEILPKGISFLNMFESA
jgi:hypothetical protein